jgi:DNA replication protein DnaC
MTPQQTLTLMRSLKLYGMANAYAIQQELPVHQQLPQDELLAYLVENEQMTRQQQRGEYYLTRSHLKQVNALAEYVECSEQRNLTKQTLCSLLDGTYIQQGSTVLITGPTGSGKSYLASALGHQACIQCKRVLYYSMPKLAETVTLTKLNGTYLKLLQQIERTALLILDDFGITPLTQEQAVVLLQILEDRYDNKGLILASQYPIAKWYDLIPDSTLADAILDRLTAKAHRIELKGESLRKKYKK